MKITVRKTINIFLLLLSVSILFSSAYFMLKTDNIYKNVYVNGIDVSYLTKDEARELIKARYPLGVLNLSFNNNTKKIQLKDIGYNYNYDEAADKAFLVGRDSNIFANLCKIISLSFGNSENIELKYSNDQEKINNFYKELQNKMHIDSKNAKIQFTKNNNIKIIPGVTGKDLDMKKFKTELDNKLNSYNTDIINIKIPVTEKPPKVTYSQLKNINGILGSFTTRFPTASDPGRAYNIWFSAQKVNNKLIMPGETVSFMKLVGKVTPENGFKSAIIIRNNKYEPGTGGGICQVSSTLYNALLESGSGIQIIERSSHSLPVHYVPKGRDATVADPKPDLVFKNNYPFPIYMVNYAANGKMISRVYGDISKKI